MTDAYLLLLIAVVVMAPHWTKRQATACFYACVAMAVASPFVNHFLDSLK